MSRTNRHIEQAKNKQHGGWNHTWDWEPRRIRKEMNEKKIKLKTKEIQDEYDSMDALNNVFDTQ